MFVSETITVQASPRNQFRTIDHTQQQIQMPQLESIQLSKSAKVVPELRSRKVYLIKDKPRNKLVWVELRIFQYKQDDSIMPADDSKYCRICLCDDGSSELIKPCKCKGSLRYVHENCLKVWILEKQGIEKVYQNDIECEVCHAKFKMDMKFTVSRQYKMICRATQGRKCCWWLQGCCSFGILGTICFLIYEIAMGRFEALVLAGVTVLFVLLILCFSLTYVSCLDQVTIEVLEPWKFISAQQENDSFSEIELDNPNKQTIQNDDPQYQTINVVQIK